MKPFAAPVKNLRWWIAALLFASMVINYIDRQTLSALAPIFKEEYGWTNADFALLLISFRVAYTVMQAVSGRILDWLGTRRGLALSVSFYSLVAALTATVQSVSGFRAFRFCLGTGEAANWPGAIKAASEWFPAKERAWAVALFDSGTSLGGVVAPLVALQVYQWCGDWRPVFVLTGSLGAIWIAVWLVWYQTPERHARISPQELAYIQQGRTPREDDDPQLPLVDWRQLLSYRQTWGIIVGRFLLDPYWFFVAEWFPLYLKSQGFTLQQSVLGTAAPLVASVFGNFAGGALSSHLIRRGWTVGRSRRAVLGGFGPSMVLIVLSLFSTDYATLIALFSYGNFAYSACSTVFLSLPADVFHSRAVASASGLGGTAAGIGTLVSTYLIGQIADQYSFQPIVLVASLVPCLAAMVFVWLVRAGAQADPRQVVLDF
ncbi:MAG: MFS transporter [Planctomycetia bacterium]|nr:MFS transporter [Planctomycetia bacterium]